MRQVRGDMPVELTSAQRKFLRSAGRRRKVDVIVGKAGLSEATLEHIRLQLARRELLKIRLLESAGDDRAAEAERIAAAVDAALVDLVGRAVVIYRPNDALAPYVARVEAAAADVARPSCNIRASAGASRSPPAGS